LTGPDAGEGERWGPGKPAGFVDLEGKKRNRGKRSAIKGGEGGVQKRGSIFSRRKEK